MKFSAQRFSVKSPIRHSVTTLTKHASPSLAVDQSNRVPATGSSNKWTKWVNVSQVLDRGKDRQMCKREQNLNKNPQEKQVRSSINHSLYMYLHVLLLVLTCSYNGHLQSVTSNQFSTKIYTCNTANIGHTHNWCYVVFVAVGQTKSTVV